MDLDFRLITAYDETLFLNALIKVKDQYKLLGRKYEIHYSTTYEGAVLYTALFIGK